MKNLTLEDHISRIDNLSFAAKHVKKYRREIKIRDYIPGQITYHMGDEPAWFSMAPDEYDEKLLKQYAEQGYEWIQLHDEWWDANRRWVKHAYDCHDNEGMSLFVEKCHEYGLKVIAYVSSGMFPEYDPDFSELFTKINTGYEGDIKKLRACSAGSGYWRKYNFDHSMQLVDRFGFDGLYNDTGYDKFLKLYFDEINQTGAYTSHYQHLPYDPEFEDYLGMIYYELKRRGKYYKVHVGDFVCPPCKEKVYDYLWVGEAGENIRNILSCADYEPYLSPAFDRRSAKISDPDLVYALTLPLVQFPLLYGGRPCGRQDAMGTPGIRKFRDLEGNTPLRIKRHEWYINHPDGPHSYSEWSDIPDDPTEASRSAAYLKLYKPMVSEDSVVKVGITEADFIRSEISDDVLISMFTNEKQYLMVSNIGSKPYTITLSDIWTDRQSHRADTAFTIEPSKILFLEKA